MAKWKIINRQTREVLGEEEAPTQRQALASARVKYGEKHRDIEASAMDRGTAPLPDLFLDQGDILKIIREWATAKGYSECASVVLWADNTRLVRARVMTLVYDIEEPADVEELDPTEAMELVEQSLS
jgi:hypothetical protein